ncbi:MAG: hypothetical protein ACHQ6T_17130 [Myxococcota bacterium]
MSATPSVKATGFQSVADDLERLVAEGRLTRAALHARLEREDLPFLGKQLAASSWVPMTTLARALQILVDLEAGDSPAGYLRERGRRAAARLHKLGLYSQFDASVETWGQRVGAITVTMGAVLYNFSRWSFESEGERGDFRTTMREATDYPDSLRIVGEGFIEYIAQYMLPDAKVSVTSRRVSADCVEFIGRVAEP